MSRPAPGLANAQNEQGHDGNHAHILVARQAMPTVHTPSKNRAMVSLVPRPQRRWMAMEMAVPTGRTTKATASSAKAASVPSRRDKKGNRKDGKTNAGDPENEEVEILGQAPDDHAHGDFAGGHVFMRISPRERCGAFFKADRRVDGKGGAAHARA